MTTTRRAIIEPAGLDVGTDCALLPDANFGIGQLVVGAAESSEVEFLVADSTTDEPAVCMSARPSTCSRPVRATRASARAVTAWSSRQTPA